MFNARLLLLTGIACFVAVASSAPAKHSPQPLDSCKRVEHKENFNGDDDGYVNAPTNGSFVYERFGIGYFNLARLEMDDHFGKQMIPPPSGDDDDHGVAAIAGTTSPSGKALGHTIGHFAIRRGSKVHAFKVKKLKYFCLQNKKPVPCVLGYKYSPATYETQSTVEWHSIGLDGPGAGEYAASWGSPPVNVVFQHLPKLQAFSFGLPIAKLDAWNSSTSTSDKLDAELNTNGTTAYLESVEFVTWECHENLPRGPLGGAMKFIKEISTKGAMGGGTAE